MNGSQVELELNVQQAKCELDKAIRNAIELGFVSAAVRVIFHRGEIIKIVTLYEVDQAVRAASNN